MTTKVKRLSTNLVQGEHIKVYDAATGDLKRIESPTGKVLAEARQSSIGVMLHYPKSNQLWSLEVYQNKPELVEKCNHFFKLYPKDYFYMPSPEEVEAECEDKETCPNCSASLNCARGMREVMSRGKTKRKQ